MLYDGFTGGQELIGNISVSLAYETLTSPLRSPLSSPPQSVQPTLKRPFRKTQQAIFLYFGLFTGEYVARVRSNVDRLNKPRIIISLRISQSPLPIFRLRSGGKRPIGPHFPTSIWPIAPSRWTIRRRTRPIARSALPPLFSPARVSFPGRFHPCRGTVFANGAPLAGATVQSAAAELPYLTGEDGEFVLFFTQNQRCRRNDHFTSNARASSGRATNY